MTPKDWALLANAAYTSKPDLGLENSAGRAVFNQIDDGFVLAMPGTNNQACTLADIDAVPLDMDEFGRVHKGIWKAFDPIWLDVSQLPVYALVGHSEGAAGAIYLGARLCLLGKPPKIIWAWEPPKTSIDNKLAEIFIKYGVELHIMHHGNDIITEIPIKFLNMNWQHAGPVTNFGTAAWDTPNFQDHFMSGIIADL